MATDDYYFDHVERSQLNQTRRRRSGRSRRRRTYLLVGLISLALLILGAPSILSHSPIGRTLVTRTAAGYGLNAEATSVRIGWITPLKITGLQLEGTQAGSKIVIDQLDSAVTIGRLLSGGNSDFGSVVARGVNISCSVSAGSCSLEQDLQTLLQPADDGSSSSGVVQIQDVSLSVTDTSGKTWTLTQSNVEIETHAEETQVSFAGVIGDGADGGGSLAGSMTIGSATGRSVTPWKLDLESQSLPLSVLSLLRLRFPAVAASLPTQFAGDASGVIHMEGLAEGTIESSVQNLEVRDLVASHGRPESRVWRNRLASLRGDLVIEGDRVIGHNLTATTDFAAATLNGAFARSLTLVGADDNPLQWLDALAGAASIEVDLALLDKALPGVLPLRDDATIISGRATASVRSLPEQGLHRSQLFVRSDSVRARAKGRAIVIEPIEIDATVANREGVVKAERFKLESSFASAIGQGSMQAGQADFQIDFGRLAAMLRPIVDMSNTTMGGSASGNIRWNASNDNVWRLTGGGNAANLLISLPDGRELKRPALRADVEAVGRWGGQSLQQLSNAKLTVNSNGLDLRAELARPVGNPSASTLLPFKLRGKGRIETLAETLGPWLPGELHDAQGGFDVNADIDASRLAGQVSGGTIELTSPKIAYGNRWFHQSNMKIHFDGRYAWPSSEFHSRSLTVAGDAVSLAVKGKATADTVDLQIAWKAKLDRIQGSVQKRSDPWRTNQSSLASSPPAAAVSDDWLVMGDCEGKATITSHDHILDIESDTSATNIAIVQPPSASAQSQTVGPMPRAQAVAFRRSRNSPSGNLSRVVWSEPNLKLNGVTHYNTASGEVVADGVQLATDWLATTLSGNITWNEAKGDVSLTGPARLKMEEVSHRLSDLFGTNVHAAGINETPLEIRVLRKDGQAIALSVVGNLGWDSGEIGGVQFGAASVPIRLTETAVQIQPAVIPVGQGQLDLAGEVFYRPGPVWVRARSGVGATNVRLTQQMTSRWLKYLAPLAANATEINGTMSAEIDEAIVVLDNPYQSQVRGRLMIEGAQMNSGPLANQIISGIEQLRAIAQLNNQQISGLGTAASSLNANSRKLVSMPAQTVEFSVQQGVVQHDRLFFEVDRAQIMTSGRVGLDGRLELVAQVPLDARWLGSDLQSLAGQPVALPVNGTLNQPRLDSSGVREVVLQLGTQAARNTAENYLQKQLTKSIDKIFGR